MKTCFVHVDDEECDPLVGRRQQSVNIGNGKANYSAQGNETQGERHPSQVLHTAAAHRRRTGTEMLKN